MIKRLLQFKTKHPFLFIMSIGFVLRLISVLFSKGFGMHDDHFLVIEQAQSWVDGGDYLKWLPGTPGNTGPEGHSFFYVSLQYIFLHMLQFFGIFDPQLKMYFVRLLHASISLFIISFGYRIASLITARETAYKVALLLSVFWFMPFLSVRNMVEMASIPFLMYGSLIILRQELIRRDNEPGYHQTSFLVAGFFLGLAFSVRYQTLAFTGGIGLALLIMRNWRGTISAIIGFLGSVILIQGFIDFLVWGRPFAEFTEYVNYNLNHAYDYYTAPFYNYFLVIGAMLIPPVSLMLIFGYIRNWKKNLILFLPVLLFLIFHSIFPNKQERFILPVIPLFIVLGMAGWEEFVNGSHFWKKRKKIYQASWAFFWLINIILLFLFTPMYSKKARVESMSYLKKYENINYFLIEDINSNVLRFPPVYYTGQWPTYDAVFKNMSYRDFATFKDWSVKDNQPSFILFYQEKNLEARIDSIQQIFTHITYETTVKPGLMDRLIHRINPINANETIYIYRNKAIIPEKITK